MRAPLTESEIKAKVLTELRSAGTISARTLLANEFAVGKTAVRADLALLGNRFIAVEIKSEADSLRRLTRQLSVYRAHFDEVVLVLAKRHLKTAPNDLFHGVSVWTLEPDGEMLPLCQAACARPAENLPFSMLLTKRERQRYATAVPETPLGPVVTRASFNEAFAVKFGPTSRAFWSHIGRRRVRADDLHLLSRFHERRAAGQELARRQAERWQQWEDAAVALDAA